MFTRAAALWDPKLLPNSYSCSCSHSLARSPIHDLPGWGRPIVAPVLETLDKHALQADEPELEQRNTKCYQLANLWAIWPLDLHFGHSVLLSSLLAESPHSGPLIHERSQDNPWDSECDTGADLAERSAGLGVTVRNSQEAEDLTIPGSAFLGCSNPHLYIWERRCLLPRTLGSVQWGGLSVQWGSLSPGHQPFPAAVAGAAEARWALTTSSPGEGCGPRARSREEAPQPSSCWKRHCGCCTASVTLSLK